MCQEWCDMVYSSCPARFVSQVLQAELRDWCLRPGAEIRNTKAQSKIKPPTNCFHSPIPDPIDIWGTLVLHCNRRATVIGDFVWRNVRRFHGEAHAQPVDVDAGRVRRLYGGCAESGADRRRRLHPHGVQATEAEAPHNRPATTRPCARLILLLHPRTAALSTCSYHSYHNIIKYVHTIHSTTLTISKMFQQLFDYLDSVEGVGIHEETIERGLGHVDDVVGWEETPSLCRNELAFPPARIRPVRVRCKSARL